MNAPSLAELTAVYVLDRLKGFGPQKFRLVHEAGLSPRSIIENPELLPIKGKIGDPLKKQLTELTPADHEECRRRAERQLEVVEKNGGAILTYKDARYPPLVLRSNNPVGVLYARGNLHLLSKPQAVACVGSRKLRPPYDDLHALFSVTAVEAGFAVVSGFALGADTRGHRAAVDAGGYTICVMPSGLDRPFPPENKDLWSQFLASDHALFVSEFPFGMGANALNLKKRNKLIVAFSQGVLVSQSAKDGGAMNAYRFALEQKKPVATFIDDGTDDTSGNREISAGKGTKRTFLLDPGRESYMQWLLGLSSLI